MRFRLDINGLRAFAVIAVVLFHFNSSWMPGGFAGVDVFFVISGFLMTGIIFRGLESPDFSILKFYIARANRIIPALAILCFVLLLFGWFYFTPSDYMELGKHVLSSLAFLSNVTYWREAGYFDSSSHSKWLLHTWSLSVEWQFYIIYPLLLIFTYRFVSIKRMKLLVLLSTVFFFLLCVFTTYKWPTSSYYLLPSRAWEMLLGGVAYLYPFRLKQKYKKALEISGLILMIYSYLFISEEAPWPGYLALIPSLGAFFIIQAQQENSFITANMVFQKIGTWSYSIYLWHWPIVVAIYYLSLDSVYTYLGLALSLILGFISYNFIELIRFKNDFTNLIGYLKCKPLYIAISIFCIGSFVFFNNGFPQRLTKEQLRIINYDKILVNGLSDKEKALKNGCDLRAMDSSPACTQLDSINYKPSAIILGDSHAGAIATGVYESLIRIKGNGEILNAGAYGCVPLLNMNHSDQSRDRCKTYNKYIYKEIKKHYQKVPIIILSRFNLYTLGFNEKGDVNKPYMFLNEIEFNEAYKAEYEKNFIKSMCSLSKNNPVFILKPLPEFGFSIPKRMAENSLLSISSNNYITESEYLNRNLFSEHLLNEAKNQCSVVIINANDEFLQNEKYYGERGGLPLYVDDNHLNALGANVISHYFDSVW